MNGLIGFIGILIILIAGRSIFIPLLVAIFLWYLINAIAAYYRKVMPFAEIFKKTKIINPKSEIPGRVFNWLAMILSFATFGGLVYLFITRIRPMFAQFSAKLPEIQTKLHQLADYFAGYFGASFDPNSLPNITEIAASAGGTIAGIATSAGLVIVYIFFIFIEQSTFRKKLSHLFPVKSQFKKMYFILHSIDENMKKYMFMKTFISAATAVGSYFWMLHLGLEFAGVWAFIIFIMNYIPTFGSIVACALPILYSLVSSSSLHTPLLVAAGLIALEIIFANILEPKLTGKTLNLSTLAILVNLVFWGILWGPVGAFFSVPLLVATFVVAAQFDKTRWLAVLLSANGEIPDKEED
ncbi:MAG: AI-2E family transporter [Rickettsiales bacterium]|jgi:predicted PurR-regulated permease PerM|nr:AI-2E family transporter [Rickettsiales bacterium]